MNKMKKQFTPYEENHSKEVLPNTEAKLQDATKSSLNDEKIDIFPKASQDLESDVDSTSKDTKYADDSDEVLTVDEYESKNNDMLFRGSQLQYTIVEKPIQTDPRVPKC